MRTDSEAEPGRTDPADEEETFADVYVEGMPQSSPSAVQAEPEVAASDAQLSDQPAGVAASSEKNPRVEMRALQTPGSLRRRGSIRRRVHPRRGRDRPVSV